MIRWSISKEEIEQRILQHISCMLKEKIYSIIVEFPFTIISNYRKHIPIAIRTENYFVKLEFLEENPRFLEICINNYTE